ncbi:MAG: hypothetical protein PVI60_00285 [Desulfobacteraceae bacterium]|jgi:hypothetical protein
MNLFTISIYFVDLAPPPSQLVAKAGGLQSQGAFEGEISIAVEGDLNKQERREIGKVIQTIDRMMGHFVQGELNPMMVKAHKLQGLETVDSLVMEISYERRVLVAQQNQAAVSYDQTGEVAPIKFIASGNLFESPITEQARAVAEDMAKEVRKAQAPLDPMMALADGLLKTCRDQAFQKSPMGGRIIDHIRDIFENAVTR